MKRQFKAAAITAGIVGSMFAAISLSPLVTADSPGQIEGGNIYRIANLTQKTPFANPQTANACDELEYSVRLHNSGFSSINNIVVSATLPSAASTSNTSNLTATYDNGVVPSTSASATVNISSAQSVSYESGSTQLLDNTGAVIKTLPNGVTTGSGVLVGGLAGSTTEYLNFKAKISCPTPVTPVFTCNDLEISAGDNRTVKVTDFSTTAKDGAVYKSAVIAWGDKTSTQPIVNPIGQSHQYGADGTYTVTATATFTVDGKDVTATGPQCQKQVTFSSVTPPKVTPPTPTPSTPAAPTALVNTGPGSVVAMFAVASGIGMYFYRKMVTRSLSRQ